MADEAASTNTFVVLSSTTHTCFFTRIFHKCGAANSTCNAWLIGGSTSAFSHSTHRVSRDATAEARHFPVVYNNNGYIRNGFKSLKIHQSRISIPLLTPDTNSCLTARHLIYGLRLKSKHLNAVALSTAAFDSHSCHKADQQVVNKTFILFQRAAVTVKRSTWSRQMRRRNVTPVCLLDAS